MITLEQFDSLEVEDAIETNAPFPQLSDEVIVLVCTQVGKDQLEFRAAWSGIDIGLWTATAKRSSGRVEWAMS